MRPLLHASIVNGRWGDPVLWIETLFERRAILFDLGDIAALPPRKIHRLEHVFVTHTHVDHFIGFDQLLRVLVGRDKTVEVYGPGGIIAQVEHKLSAYRWNLVGSYACDLVFRVSEIQSLHALRNAQFRLKTGFRREEAGERRIEDGVICRQPSFRVAAALIEHGDIPCLAFAIEEAAHANVWKNKLKAQELPVGPWLKDLKRAVIEGRPDNHPIRLAGKGMDEEKVMPLGELKEFITVTAGQKIAYVTDAADTESNRQALVKLISGADLLFIEAAFAAEDREFAQERGHLTTRAAGEIAREAGVRRVEAFHFSPRYEGQEARMLEEVSRYFSGGRRPQAADL
jgi:ribonuclease Z